MSLTEGSSCLNLKNLETVKFLLSGTSGELGFSIGPLLLEAIIRFDRWILVEIVLTMFLNR